MAEALDQPGVVDFADRIFVALGARCAVARITLLCLGLAGFLLRVRHGSAMTTYLHCTGRETATGRKYPGGFLAPAVSSKRFRG